MTQQDRTHKWRAKHPGLSAAYSRKWRALNPERNKELRLAWRKKNAEKLRDLRRRREYGLELGEYDRLKTLQNGKCPICNKPVKLVVDHNHGTDKFRGLLCSLHNAALGFFDDSPEMLERAAQYLRSASPL